MGTRTIAVQHGGKTYSGEIATIKGTTLGQEDHGIITAYLHCEWPGGGISVGGFCLDEPRRDDTGKVAGRFGTAYGLDHLMRIMDTVGVPTWEKLTGAKVVVLFDAEPGQVTWGKQAVGIAGLLNDKVLILAEHATEWRDDQAVDR